MDRLLLGVIAVIGLHTAFVLYVANVRRVDENTEVARRAQTAAPSPQIPVKPMVGAETQAPEAPPIAANPPASVIAKRADRGRSRASRLGNADGAEARVGRQHRPSGVARFVPAFPANARPTPGASAKSFGDRIIVYKAKAPRPSPTLNAVVQSTADDSDSPKPRKSLIAKLQYVYKKPWDLIKAVGSKLR